ncbi:hypothetical protein KJ068_05850 [bacterium]|nr:hypothetical protein [bacterium]
MRASGAFHVTAKREDSCPDELLLMEAAAERENMLRAYTQVVRNDGAAAIDEMPVSELAHRS